MPKAKSEAEKFFESLPSETQEKQFNFFEEPAKEEPKKEEQAVVPEKEEPKEESEEVRERRLNRQERRQKENSFWEKQLAEEKAARERLETELLKRSQSESKEEADARLTRLFGDTPQGKEASRIVQELLKETEERAVTPYKELAAERQAEAQREAQFDQEIESGLASVEDTYGVDLTSRTARQVKSDFLDFVDELSPEDGFVNFDKAWELFQGTQKVRSAPEDIERKKQVASRSIQRSAPQRPDSTKLEPVSFEKVDGIFARMFGKN